MSTTQSNLDLVSSDAADDSPAADEGIHTAFLNRELSWLAFNGRVLHEAMDGRTPLLERVRFLSIFTSNLDEFYMKRVGGLKRQVAAGVMRRSADGRTPLEQLAAIRQTVLPALRDLEETYTREIHPALRGAGIELLEWSQLTEQERQRTSDHFRTNVFPVLTPLSVDPGHPFPFISNLSLSLGVALRAPQGGEKLFARVKVPPTLPQWLRVDEPVKVSGDQTYRFVSLVDIIEHNLETLFPHMQVLDVMRFRLTRNADVERDEEDADDLLEMIEQEVRERRFEKVVRVEFARDPDPWMYQLLIGELEVTGNDVYDMPAGLNVTALDQIADLNLPQYHEPPWAPAMPAALADDATDIFAAIRAGDLFVHHPYESFAASVERFIRAAADDPKVMAIKMTVYRTGDDSPFIRTLIRAAEAGKQVVCLVELKARFDEERNVKVAQSLEQAGVHVVYGIVGYKTHTKTVLVVRSEPDGLRSYTHIGTGNYHTGTAKLYTDVGLFTCHTQFTEDVAQVFNYLTGRSLLTDYQKLLVAPVNMEERFTALIEREIELAEAGKPARIIAKMNSLEHRRICRALYRASQAGVSIDLIVRGFCCLRPQVKGLSENIRVISVIGRFLEHSRIFYFRAGAEDPIDGAFFIGSADWMYRNLRARVEAITPIETRAHKARCMQIFDIMLDDQRQAWDMQSDGTYVQRTLADVESHIGTHQQLMNLHRSPGVAG